MFTDKIFKYNFMLWAYGLYGNDTIYLIVVTLKILKCKIFMYIIMTYLLKPESQVKYV